MPQLVPKFATLRHLFTSEILLHIMHCILSHMLGKKSHLQADSHVERVLHLITMAVHEDKLQYEIGNTTLDFCTIAQSKSGLNIPAHLYTQAIC